jgi:hypothetical protein
MTCRKVPEYNGRAGKQRLAAQTPSGPVFAPFRTEAECNEACREGACCEGATCTVKPQCQCQGTGKTFKGVGTTCADGACECKCGCLSAGGVSPDHIYATLSGGTAWDGTYVLDRLSSGIAATESSCFQSVGLNYAAFGSQAFWGTTVGSRCCCTYAMTFPKTTECSVLAPVYDDIPWFADNSVGGFIFISPLGSWITLPYRPRTENGRTCCFSIMGSTLNGSGLPGLSFSGGYCSVNWSVFVGGNDAYGRVNAESLTGGLCPSYGTLPSVRFHV